MPCPLSPPIDLASIQILPPSKLEVLSVCTQTKPQRLEKKITPDKLMHGTGVGVVQVGGSIMGEGKGDTTMSQLVCQQWDVPDAMDDEGVPKVSGDGPLDPEVGVDEDGYPTIFGDIMMSEVALDEDGFPTIFSHIIMGESKECEDVQDDEMLPDIRPINPNVRARKLEVNAAAKAMLEEDLANGVAPTVKKRLKSKQSTKAKTVKAKMIQQLWHQSEEDPQEAKASNKNMQRW